MAEDLLSTLIGLVRFRVRSNLPIAGFSVVIFPGEGQLLNPRTYDFLSNVFLQVISGRAYRVCDATRWILGGLVREQVW